MECDRYRGAMLGLAIGDALGSTLEFCRPGTFEPIRQLLGGGPFRLQPGQWTDDTAMALCLAESLIAQGRFDPVHVMTVFHRWWRKGHLSCTGICFDIGSTTASALARFEATGEPYCGATDPYMAGNGCIMRLAPVPLAYAAHPAEAVARAVDSARTTHGAVECLDATRYLAGLIVGAVQGRSKDELLSPYFTPVAGLWTDQPLTAKVAEVAGGSFKHRQPPEIRGSGYVVHSLEAALWAFHSATNFEEGALLAVNLGDDADTTGAVYGQLAGAFYGVEAIPGPWLEQLSHRDQIDRFARQLHQLADHLTVSSTD